MVASVALSPRAAAVAGEAQWWAARLEADLVYLHVGADDPATRARLEEFLKPHLERGARLEVRSGKPGKVIVQAASDLGADLIITGALERESMLRYYVGSVARQVARHARCSVLLLAEPGLASPVMRQWVIAVGYDDVSRRMLRLMAGVAARTEPGRIDVVAEYGMSGAGLALEGDLDLRGADAQLERMNREEESRIADLLAETGFVREGVRPICLRGRVGYESAEHARRVSADLLVAAAPHVLGFWQKFIQQGVEFALEELPCALWLYRPPQGGAARGSEGRGPGTA